MLGSRSFMVRLLAMAAVVGAVALPAPAQAWWRGGLAFGFFVPPVYIAPPPVYYPPPPAYYVPPSAYAPARWSTICEAGPYVCPLEVATAAGAPCSCPANNGRAWGRAR